MRYGFMTIAALSLFDSAFAQTVSQPANGGLEEIVVTAQKREQNLQDVGASVVAFNAEALNAAGVEDPITLQQHTPGMVLSTNGPYGQPYIRGVGSDIINPGTDAPIAIFEDGAYQPRPNAAITEFFDLDRVEVLKGPQGTLYGRNASGGAINIVTHDPDMFLSSDGDAIFGNYGRVTVRNSFNAPLSDTLAVRIAGVYTEHGGYTTNLFDGSKLDNENQWGVRGKVKYAPRSDFSIVLTLEHIREHDSRDLPEKVLDSPDLPLPVRDLAPLLGYTAPPIPANPRDVYENSPNVELVSNTRANAILSWDLGPVLFKFTSGYTDVWNDGILDLDGTQINFSYDNEADHSNSVIESLQLSSLGAGPLQWMVGAEYFHENGGQNFDARLPNFGAPSSDPYGPEVAGFIWNSGIQTSSASGFADLTYMFSPQWSINAGIRYTWEHKRANFLETLIDPFGALTGLPGGTYLTPAMPHATFSAWTPKVRLEYRPKDDILLYASATRGFKSGGFNLMNTGEEFQPEKIWSYELGLKSTWLDKRLRGNAAAFYYNYRDLQVNQFSGVTNLVTNAANSRITGVEVEIEAQPISALQTDLSFAYLDAIYLNYYTHNATDPTGPELDLSGNRMPKAPRSTVTLATQYSWPIDVNRLTLRGEVRYQSLVYFDQFDSAEVTQAGYALFNGRLSYAAPNDRWSVAVFGQNLGDKLYRQSMVRVDNVFGTVAFFGAPRTYGVEFSYRVRP
jgi:iron complex outermembrane receptor protein